MNTMSVVSADGSRIVYEQVGAGPHLLLVDGAFCGRSFGPMRALAKHLAGQFTVTFYDRRGRGESTDVAMRFPHHMGDGNAGDVVVSLGPAPASAAAYRPSSGGLAAPAPALRGPSLPFPSDTTAQARTARHPASVAREVEDIRALVASMGETPYIYGCSSGAVLAARAVAAGVPAKGLAIYEPPLALDGTHFPKPTDYIEQIDAFLAAGKRRDAVKLFMKVVGMPAFAIFIMQLFPGVFSKLDRAATTLPHDFAILGDTQRGGPLPDELATALGQIHVPTTVMSGSKSPAWMAHAAERVASLVPGASTRVIPGQNHNVSAKAMGPVLKTLFAAK